LAVPTIPYRGIAPFRYADHEIFFAREEETRLLMSLVAVYRGVFLYGDSGNGKSSLINAGLLPEARRLGYDPVRVRVQPRAGEELVIEQIAISDEGGDVLPCVLAPEADSASRVVLSIEQFQQRVHTASKRHRPLLIFDQFEELVTLFDAHHAAACRRQLVAMILALLREELPVKVLFAFREDYLAKIKRLLAARPELVDQELRLGPPSAGALPTIIRGPFDRFPGRYDHELDAPLAHKLGTQLAERFGTGEVSLSEVQTVCLRLYNAPDPHALLTDKGIQGLLEDDLGEALDSFPGQQRDTAIALLSQMITDAGTRNVISAEDLRQRIADTDDTTAPELLDDTLTRLERDSKLVRRERRRDIYLYEITSEFLVPWISQRRHELQLAHQRQHERRRLRILATITTGLLIIAALIAALAIDARHQRNEAQHQRSDAQHQTTQARSLALASSASVLRESRPDVSLLLADEAYRLSPRVEARSSMLAALTDARDPGVLAILHGHRDAVYSVAVSPDGHTLASTSADKTIRLWDTRTHKQLGAPLTGHTNTVYNAEFSPDGRTLATASSDKTIRLWDTRTHNQVGRPLEGHTDQVDGVAFSPDGRTLASASLDETIRLWDVRTHEQLGKLTGHTGGAVNSVVFSPDGRRLASAGYDGTVRLWDPRTHKLLGKPLRGHAGPVESVAFSPDGRTLASASDDDTIRLWEVRTHKQLGKPLRGHTRDVRGAVFSPDGRTLASASEDKTVRLWDVRTHKQLSKLGGHTDAVWSVAFSPDGRTLASASVDKTIRLWNARRQQPLGEPLNGHTDAVWKAVFSPDGRTLASASYDKTIRLWDMRTHKQLGESLAGPATVQSVAYSPDGRTLASASGNPMVPGGGDTTIRLWDTRTHKQVGKLTGRTDAVWSVAFSPDGRTLASAGGDPEASGGGDTTIRLWDVRTHKQLGKPLRGHTDVVFSVAFSPDGRTLASAGGDFLASGGGDTTIRLWDVRTHKQLGKPLRGHTDVVWSVAFSPDGRTLASASADTTIRLWDVRTHRQLGPPLTGHRDVVQSAAFSPDGNTLASASRDKTVRLWDTATHKQLGIPLRGHNDRVNSVAFSPDGRTLASASGDTTVRLWENLLWRNAAELRTTVCKLVGSGLSRTEWKQYAAGIPYHQTCP
jgi:WD40 repeat protein